jgi:hypothetical protein
LFNQNGLAILNKPLAPVEFIRDAYCKILDAWEWYLRNDYSKPTDWVIHMSKSIGYSSCIAYMRFVVNKLANVHLDSRWVRRMVSSLDSKQTFFYGSVDPKKEKGWFGTVTKRDLEVFNETLNNSLGKAMIVFNIPDPNYTSEKINIFKEWNLLEEGKTKVFTNY